MMKIARSILCLTLLLVPVALAQQGPDNTKEEDERVKETLHENRRFWEASVPGGHYMVALDRIANVSMHQYALDGSLVVHEVTVDTTGRALARFYYIEPISESMNRNEVSRVVDKGRQLIERAGQRLGSDVHNMVQKSYPTTTHAGMIEYRLLDMRDLSALYGSLRRAWESGKGRKITIQ